MPYPAMRWTCMKTARSGEPESSPNRPDTSSAAMKRSRRVLAQGNFISARSPREWRASRGRPAKDTLWGIVLFCEVALGVARIAGSSG